MTVSETLEDNMPVTQPMCFIHSRPTTCSDAMYCRACILVHIRTKYVGLHNMIKYVGHCPMCLTLAVLIKVTNRVLISELYNTATNCMWKQVRDL